MLIFFCSFNEPRQSEIFKIKFLFSSYFLEILSSNKLSTSINEIELHDDGSWSTVVVKKEEEFDNDDCSVRTFCFFFVVNVYLIFIMDYYEISFRFAVGKN